MVAEVVVMQRACLLGEGVVGEVGLDLGLSCSQEEAGVKEEGTF